MRGLPFYEKGNLPSGEGKSMESTEPMATRPDILRYAREKLSTEPDCPFSSDTQTLVLRHADSGK